MKEVKTKGSAPGAMAVLSATLIQHARRGVFSRGNLSQTPAGLTKVIERATIELFLSEGKLYLHKAIKCDTSTGQHDKVTNL